MAGEFDIIARHFAPLARAPGAHGLSDDAADLSDPAGASQVVTLDTMVAGVHFRPADPPALIARKLLRVNLSDLAAKGAAPVGYFLSAAFERGTAEDWIADFAQGLGADQETYGLTLLGGDTVATPGPVVVSATMIGHRTAGAPALLRSGTRPGEMLFVTGTLGDAAPGLRLLERPVAALSDKAAAYLIERYRLPRPRTTLGPRLPGLASAALDISDGLIADAGHLARSSGVRLEIDAEALPLSPALLEARELGLTDVRKIVSGGDDYEILFAARDPQAVAAAARAAGVEVTAIGRVVAGEGVILRGVEGEDISIEQGGYTHF